MTTLRLSPTGSLPVLIFDLENRPLAYWYPGETTAEITAIGWKWAHEDGAQAMLLRRDGRFVDDEGRSYTVRRAYQAFRNILVQAGIVVGHNVRGHDLPLIQTALLRHGLEPLGPILVSDTLRDYPRRKGMSASLENLSEMYGVDDQGGKKHMSQVAWEHANRLSPDGLELARERVVSDVLLQERLRGVMLDMGVLREPRVWRQ